MQRIAQFEKISFKQFMNDWSNIFNESNIETIVNIFDNINLPQRATQGSAGHDFMCPIDVTLLPGQTAKIPTGIRCRIADGWVLTMFPRSSLGFKNRMQLDNTVGIIDSDYYYSDNEGHIFVKFTNDSKEGKIIELHKGDNFVQGVFLPFGITFYDDVKETRNGGFGSTNK